MPARTLVIGDVHGCLANFDALLQTVAPTPADHLVLLGDLIDRGPDSAGVVARVLKLSRDCRVTTIIGNHEQMLLAARASHDKFSDWIRNGGDATLHSYAGARGKLRDIPTEHWSYFEQKLVDYVETDTHIFIHANAYPDLDMSEQPDYMLRWERCDKIAAHKSGKILVCGHTPQKSGRPLNKGYAICIDTHACGGGPLTCLDVDSGRIWQADARGHVQRANLCDFSDE